MRRPIIIVSTSAWQVRARARPYSPLADATAMGAAKPFRYGPNGGAKGHPRFPWLEYFDSPEEAAARAARAAALEAE